MKKILVFGAILTNMLILEGRNSAFATGYKYRGDGAVFEITESDNLPTQVPNTQALVAGTLDTTDVRTFDLVVTGNCKVGGDTVGLDVVPGEKRPDLFTLDNGVIKFADPQRLGTFTMPRGHEATVTISLEEIRDKESGKTTPATDIKRAEDYLCLGIRQKEKPTQIIYKSGNASTATASIDLKGGEKFELVPLVSTTDVSETNTCTAVEQKSDVPAGFITGNAIDFSAVYRVNISMEEKTGIDQSIPKTAVWQKPTRILNEITAAFQYNHCGVGKINGKIQLLEREKGGGLIVSEDGINWNKLDSNFADIEPDGKDCIFAHGNGQWWGASLFSSVCSLFFSPDGIHWELTDQTINRISSMDFGKDRFMITTGDGEVYTLLKGETEWHQPQEENLRTVDSSYSRVIYGNGRWVCVRDGHSTIAYDTGDEKSGWREIENSKFPATTGNTTLGGGCYAHGYFYVLRNNCIAMKYKFSGESGWEEEKITGGGVFSYGITYFEPTDSIFIYHEHADSCLVGSFND